MAETFIFLLAVVAIYAAGLVVAVYLLGLVVFGPLAGFAKVEKPVPSDRKEKVKKPDRFANLGPSNFARRFQ